MPIWILYWFQILFPVNYAIKLGVITLVLNIIAKQTDNMDLTSVKTVVKGLCFSVIAEITGLSVFWILEMKMNLPMEVYYRHYTAVSVFALCVAMLINFFLNWMFNFKKAEISKAWKIAISAGIALLTAPVIFLLPSGIEL